MPYKSEWVDPEVALVHNGITVYHTYRSNDWDEGVNDYWFTLDSGMTDSEDGTSFDIRDFPEPTTGPKLSDHPPYLGTDRGKELGFATYEEWKASDQHKIESAAWEVWHKVTNQQAILNTLRHAIDAGLIKLP